MIRLAAPSWVIPGTIEENCLFLSHKVHEVGLLFFETAASLSYTEADLPPSLAALPLSYHVHLPSDLPGESGENDARICLALLEKTAHLEVQRAVLHLPANGANAYLESFVSLWCRAGKHSDDILLENTRENSLLPLIACIQSCQCSICIDTGHAFAYGHDKLFTDNAILERTKMVHVNSIKKGLPGHQPLTTLSQENQDTCSRLLCTIPETAVCMIELFSWEKIVLSLPLVQSWITARQQHLLPRQQ